MEETIIAETAENQYVDNTKRKKTEKKTKEPKKKKDSRTGLLKFIQHLLITGIAVALIVVIMGSTVVVPMYSGNVNYNLSTTDEGRDYSESVLFNTIFGNELSDVFRLVTIKTQLEAGGIYDSKKVIDVVAYNSRENVASSVNNTLTANYYLGDLLKWRKFGFEYENLSQAQMSQEASILASNPYDGTATPDTAFDDSVQYSMLKNRYNTIDGMNVEDMVISWGQYEYLVDQIKKAADDLYTNYTDYLGMSDYYDESVSNIRYCVVMGKGLSQITYSNIDVDKKDINKLDSIFEKYGKYIIYKSDDMRYRTNTSITESLFNNLFAKYDYAFSDDCQIYIAVDMNMPAQDSFVAGAKGFSNYLPYYKQLLVSIILCSIIYVLLLVYCTIKEGVAYDENGKKYIKLTSFDYTPIEIWIFLIVVFFTLFYGTLINIYPKRQQLISLMFDNYFLVVVAALVFIADILILGLYYSFVRRIKGKNIWKPSLVNRIYCLIVKLCYSAYDNSGLIVRSIVPFGIIILLNIFVVHFLSDKGFGVPVFGIAILLIDLFVGGAIYIQAKDRSDIIDGMGKISSGDLSYKAEVDKLHGDNKDLAKNVNTISDAVRNAVEQSSKDERMKTDLVANVSHDIRTPLTSIINYVDLMKRETINNENLKNYINIIDEKSQRLKTLTDDLIEASKASSGNIELNMQKMNLPELVDQTIGEFSDKFNEHGLSVVVNTNSLTNPYLLADGKSMWRVMENLLGNIYKYAMTGTRVFIDIFNVNVEDKSLMVMQIKNMSANPLPDNIKELTDRFSRGDVSRTTEGNGLGLSIAKSLTELMNGKFEIASEADLFKVELCFENVNEN